MTGLAPDSFDSDDQSIDPVDEEHHTIFGCSGNAHALEPFFDLSQGHISRVSHFLNEPQCKKMANFLTRIDEIEMIAYEQSLV